MSDRVTLDVEVSGFHLHFEGNRAFFDEALKESLSPLAAGKWRAGPPVAPEEPAAAAAPAPSAPAAAQAYMTPAALPPAPTAASLWPAGAPSPARGTVAPFQSPMNSVPSFHAPAAPPALRPAPRSVVPAPEASAIDAAPLYARLAKEEARRSERDAVLLALVALAVEGKKDATPAEVLAHMESHGYPSREVKAKPVLAKLCHRKGLAAPGLLPNTFRVTPAGAAHIFRLSREA